MNEEVVDKIMNKLGEELKNANKYVEDLKHLEKRMDNVKVDDEVFFLKQDVDDKRLWNCGCGVVLSVDDIDGLTKLSCPAKQVKQVFLKSESYPFHVAVDPEHLLKNWTDQTRSVEKEEKKYE